MLSNELIAQIRFLELKSKRMASDVLSGNYASAFHGRGLDFQEVREYSPGDEVRSIDWNVTARTGIPHIKIYREERELTVILAIDVSRSVLTATQSTRASVAHELAAVIAWLAIRNNDRVGLLLFSDKIEFYSPPKKGRGHVWQLIKDVYSFKPSNKGTDIKMAFEYLEKIHKRRATCFVISDFWSGNFDDALKRCSRQHDLTCVAVRDQNMKSLPDVGLVRWRDSETGETRLIDTSDSRVRDAFEAATTQMHSIGHKAIKSGADYFEIDTNESVIIPLTKYLRGHHKGSQNSVGTTSNDAKRSRV
ncbi:MAG: DUF58 domain-containing protein [Proteobacteria bacterium]|nr:DUF58 domain-containing protein [Pseudomonadota bacterium]